MANKFIVYVKQIETRDPLTAKKHLLNVGHKEELSKQFFENRKLKIAIEKADSTWARETGAQRGGRGGGSARTINLSASVVICHL